MTIEIIYDSLIFVLGVVKSRINGISSYLPIRKKHNYYGDNKEKEGKKDDILLFDAKEIRYMRTIVITNQKGGCGKTTTALNLAAALAQLGQRVLIVDLDPQAHATLGLGYNPEKLDKTIYNALVNRKTSLSKIIINTKSERLHLAPSNIRLAKADIELSAISQKEFVLAKQLRKVNDKYDICIVDCPPSLGLLTFNALVASTDIIVPVQVHYYALEGLKQLLETVK
ncbi:ParA family protein, partial [Planctomycetota bacterium]